MFYNIRIKLSFLLKIFLVIKWKLLSIRLFYVLIFKFVIYLFLWNGDLNFKLIYKSMFFFYLFRMFIVSDYIVFVFVLFIEYFLRFVRFIWKNEICFIYNKLCNFLKVFFYFVISIFIFGCLVIWFFVEIKFM